MIMNTANNIEILEEKPKGLDWSLKAINVKGAWKQTKGEGVKVVVIDTGVDMSHEEIKDNLFLTINMHNHTTDVTDEGGHGSHVASLICGKNTGVAPDVQLYVAKVLNKDGLGSMANIVDGINMAINVGADVLCMSLGMMHKLPVNIEQKLLQAHEKGITIVCAVGNDNRNSIDYPAKYDFVISVGGVGKDLKRAEFSNYGKEIDIVAPSVDVLGAYKDGKYARMSGTSMASPLVAGAIALLISKYRKEGKELSPLEIKDIIIDKLGNYHSYDYGWGLLDVSKLLS